jgi:ATP-dependent Clp protease ATP-binding subunit ClpC
MWQFFNEKGKRVVQQAHKEALRLGHDVIGTEHLLLGILDEVDPACSSMFESHGVAPEEIRLQLEAVLEKGVPKEKIIDLPLSQRAKRVLDISMREARGMGVNYVGAEHILLGLLSEGEGLAGQILGHLGFNISRRR